MNKIERIQELFSQSELVINRELCFSEKTLPVSDDGMCLIIDAWDDSITTNLKRINGHLKFQLPFIPKVLSSIEQADVIDFSGCGLDHLYNLPYQVTNLKLEVNQLRSLDGLPPVLNILNISNNPIESLVGIPPMLEMLLASNTNITSLAGLSENLKHIKYQNTPIYKQYALDQFDPSDIDFVINKLKEL